jgi:hypothetical protein
MPEDRRSIAVDSLLCDLARLFWAFSELMLVVTLMTIGVSPNRVGVPTMAGVDSPAETQTVVSAL